MTIERLTGGKPQEIRKPDQASAERKATEARKDSDVGKSPNDYTAEVSDRSRAAIKAYRLAQESKPYIARATKIAELKAKVAKGEYHPSNVAVADAVLKHVASGGKSSL